MLFVGIVIPIIRHYQIKAAVNRYRAELKAKGEPMELLQAIPSPVPTNQNSAPLFLKAISLFVTNTTVLNTNQPPNMRMIAPGKAMVGWKQSNIQDSSIDATNSWSDIHAALKEEQSALNLLHTLPQKPLFDFKLHYADGFGMMKLSPLAKVKNTVRKLAASATDNLHSGDTKVAARDIQAMLALVNGFSHDRILISELVRMSMAGITQATTWEFLQSSEINDEQLAELQCGWANTEFLQTFENAMAIERTVGSIEMSKLRDHGFKSYFEPLEKMGLFNTEESLWSGLKVKYKSVMWRYWWSYPDELRELKGVQYVMDATRQARTNYSFFALSAELKIKIESLGIKPDEDDSFWFSDPANADFHFIFSSSTVAFKTAFNKVLKIEAAKQLTITAIALKRYQLKHGNYPGQLSELTPEFFASVPRDPVDGNLLRYRRNTDGTFLLYSIGEDGVDNGGNPALKSGSSSKSSWWQHRDALDWVWPQPATPAEVQFFYDHPPK